MIIFYLFWLILPASVANLVPPFASLLFPQFSQPLDFGHKFRQQRIFGDHKTIRGLFVGTLLGFFVFVLQKYYSPLGYQHLSYLFGFLLSFLALFGDLVKSFFKRQLNVVPGSSWFPWDQIDWLIGPTILIYFYTNQSLVEAFLILIIGLVSHLVAKYIGYLLRINSTSI